jgi:excisionase family DNA binding protein
MQMAGVPEMCETLLSGGLPKARFPMTTSYDLDYRSVSELLGIPVATVRTLVFRKQIPFLRVSVRKVVFASDEIEEWIEARRCVPERRAVARIPPTTAASEEWLASSPDHVGVTRVERAQSIGAALGNWSGPSGRAR